LTALAAVSLLAAVILLRDHFRLERHAMALAADIERLQGEIRSLARIGEGSRDAAGVQSESGFPSERAPEAADQKPKRVLLAEDDEVNALLAVKTLERAGATIDWAKDGEEAVALVAESFAGARPAYDLVLMDLRMPRLGGLDATRRIRALEAATGRTAPLRIAAVTATTMRRDRRDARNAGMDHFLSKPYGAHALAQLLEPMRGGLAQSVLKAS
jgi:CheY-like chemotaxis protein